MDQDKVDSEFSHVNSLYFNTAYFGPSPLRAKEEVQKALKRELDPSFYGYEEWKGIADFVREQFARILSCSPDCIAHGTSVSDFNNTIALGYHFREGDVICVPQREYPSNVLPWMLAEKRGKVKLHFWDLNEELPRGCRILNMSQVSFETGKRVDIKKIGTLARKKGILFILDVTQGLGGLSLSKEEFSFVDILTCSSYKWILGPYGHAFAYFSPKAQELIDYTHATWTKSPNSQQAENLLNYTIDPLPGARKYDRGQPSNMLTLACLKGSLALLDELGLETIEEHNQKLCTHLLDNLSCDKLKPLADRELMANILSFDVRGIDPFTLMEQLKKKNVDLSVREGRLRLSIHLFNTKEQVDKLLHILSSL